MPRPFLFMSILAIVLLAGATVRAQGFGQLLEFPLPIDPVDAIIGEFT
ncbi:MAG: hypothetical protein R3F20_08960 [Planctomycetota bacterium]